MGDVAHAADRVLDELERAVVGKRRVLETVLGAVLAGGHVLIEDVPGVAKTVTARSFADVLQLSFSRVQFTPDLVPADVTGSAMPVPSDGGGMRLAFEPGPVFANLVLGDEINRAPPKTQAAVLEAMAEQQVTADGVTHPLPDPFIVLATQNPVEAEGTYPLPEAQLDRFLVRVSVGYPDAAAEAEVVRRRVARGTDRVELSPVLDAAELLALRAGVEAVAVADEVVDYAVAIAAATRDHASVEIGASPRGTLGLVAMGRATAAMAGRDFVTPDDLRAVAVPTLAHRLVLRAEAWVRGADPADIVAEALAGVPVPQTLTPADRAAVTT